MIARRPRITAVAALATPAAMAALTLGACGGGSSDAACTCGDDQVVIALPPDRASQVVEVKLSGAACDSVAATCTKPVASGCAQYTFRAASAGACDVDLLFASAPSDFQAQVSFAAVACCPGYWPQPPSAARIDVPGAMADAGEVG